MHYIQATLTIAMAVTSLINISSKSVQGEGKKSRVQLTEPYIQKGGAGAHAGKSEFQKPCVSNI
jgi:hypothetical protein